MIITCINCNKKFDINSDLIPINGRLLECSSCGHQWFFKIKKDENIPKSLINDKKKEIKQDTNNLKPSKKEEKQKTEIKKSSKNIEPIVDNFKIKQNDDLIYDLKLKKKKKKLKIQNLIVVFIISFIAFVILIDTFKYPISIIIPNIEFLLNNLYESVKDLILFLNDLI